MTRSKRKMDAREDTFSLTVDEYGRLWLHTKQDRVEVAIDLAEQAVAYEIMAAAMVAANYEH